MFGAAGALLDSANGSLITHDAAIELIFPSIDV